MKSFLKSNTLILIIALSLFIGCQSAPVIDETELNLDEWRTDREGCQGLRLAELGRFKSIKKKLIGVDENRIIKLLGRPDACELGKRNQKVYTYYTEPSKACKPDAGDTRQAVQIRFNATHEVNQVSILISPNQ
ncbi:MAG: hypothetical protein EAZ67_04335 [Cytophagales bacterium]|nr:MAG: hypothetical protein EAZ67_04335 [Cytophagales bacterium]